MGPAVLDNMDFHGCNKISTSCSKCNFKITHFLIFFIHCWGCCILGASSVLGRATPDSKVHGASMGPTWERQDPGGPHVGPMNLVIWDMLCRATTWMEVLFLDIHGMNFDSLVIIFTISEVLDQHSIVISHRMIFPSNWNNACFLHNCNECFIRFEWEQN